jgi:lipopolysaccharide export system protein LptA
MGKGYIFYRPAPKADAAAPATPFEVHYEKSGTFDDGALEAVFDGNVRVKRTTMDLSGQHVVMHFAKRAAPATAGASKPGSNLDVSGITAEEDVTLFSGAPPDRLRASGNKLAWDRVKGTADLIGTPARVIRDKTDITAPVMLGTLKNDQLDRVATTGGGHMVGYTSPLQKPQTPAAAPGAKSALEKLDVTWKGDGLYETLETKDPASEPTAAMRVKESVHAVTKDSDVTSDTLVVYMGPQAKPSTNANTGMGGLKLEMRNLFAIGNARAKTFMTDGNYYRYARGDTLEWDRLSNRMTVSADNGEAVVWDNSNEWVGKLLVVNKAAEGKFDAEIISGRKIIFYEEGTPKTPSSDTDEARKWKPIY